MFTEEKLIDFLKLLEAELPPSCGHHALSYALSYAQDRLALHVRRHNGVLQTLFLDPGDLEKPASQLVGEIQDILTREEGETDAQS